MRWIVAPMALCLLIAAAASGQDEKRCAERTPPSPFPQVHSMKQSGYSASVAPYGVPSVTRYDAVGYIGGASLLGNGPHPLRSKATGPLVTGTFGQDFGGFAGNTGRVFLAPTVDPGIGPAIYKDYRTDGPYVPNIFAFRPLRKLVIEKRDAREGKGGHE